MRPKLKIGPLTQLQDARSSAAVGFDILSFSLERGSMKKMSPAMIWNMVNWIQGPEILLELNAVSLEELEEMNKSFQANYVQLPLSEWDAAFLSQLASGIYLKAGKGSNLEEIKKCLSAIEKAGNEAYVEISLDEISEVGEYQAILEKSYLHFRNSDTLFEYLKQEGPNPLGFALGEEFREDAEYLDYEKIDELIELMEELFVEE
ncbi:MAG: hypothetical protein AAFR87_07165 [Bacteroidota bacterium]